MKLLVAIINNDDIKALTKNLVKNKIYSTKLSSTGGFLSSGNTTLLIGCADDDVEKILDIIKENAKERKKVVPPTFSQTIGYYAPVEVVVGGATVFVLDVEQFHKL